MNRRQIWIVGKGAAMVLCLCLLLAGCSAWQTENTVLDPNLSADYRTALERWTERDVVYRDFVAELRVRGTFKSPSFRRAYAAKYARDYRLTEAEASDLLAGQMAEAGRSLEFLLAVSTSGKKATGLADRDSAWKVYLEWPGGRAEPFEIHRVDDKTARLVSFYPYITPWSDVYQVRFLDAEALAASGPLKLVITGVLGSAELVYETKD